MKIIFIKYPHRNKSVDGLYFNGIIKIKSSLPLLSKISTILHELGHYIIDKLRLGTNVDYIYDILTIFFNAEYKDKPYSFKWITKDYFGK